MWPSLNQLLCAALPKEVVMSCKEGWSCLCNSMLGARTKHLSRKKIKEIPPPLSRRGGATQFTVHSGSPRPASKPGDLSSPLTPFTNKTALGLQRARCFPPPSLSEAARPPHCSPETPRQGGSPGLPRAPSHTSPASGGLTRWALRGPPGETQQHHSLRWLPSDCSTAAKSECRTSESTWTLDRLLERSWSPAEAEGGGPLASETQVHTRDGEEPRHLGKCPEAPWTCLNTNTALWPCIHRASSPTENIKARLTASPHTRSHQGFASLASKTYCKPDLHTLRSGG